MVLGYSAGADAGATITPRACNPPQRRRRSATRGVAAAHPKCACGAHVVCSVVVLASRPRAASNGPSQRRLSDVSAPDAAEYARALTKCCVARSGHSRRRSRPCSVSLSHMLAADLGESFGAAASVLPAGGALNKGSVGSWAQHREGGWPIMTKTAPPT